MKLKLAEKQSRTWNAAVPAGSVASMLFGESCGYYIYIYYISSKLLHFPHCSSSLMCAC